jgi:hypothetical protein
VDGTSTCLLALAGESFREQVSFTAPAFAADSVGEVLFWRLVRPLLHILLSPLNPEAPVFLDHAYQRTVRQAWQKKMTSKARAPCECIYFFLHAQVMWSWRVSS